MSTKNTMVLKIFGKKNSLLLLAGVTCCIAGILFQIYFSFILNTTVKILINFYENSTSYNGWIANKEPYNYDIYFFNWTNPEDVYDPDIKPKFEKIGPYSFHLYISKANVSVHDNGTTTFTKFQKWIYAGNESIRSLDDEITSINPIPNTIAYNVRNWNIFAKMGVSFAYRTLQTKVHITKTVREFLFDGFHDPILDAVHKVPLASKFIIDKFGYYYKKNYTDNPIGPINFHHVIDDHFGQIELFKGRNQTGTFKGSCGRVQGGLGEFTQMNRDVRNTLMLFITELNSYTPLDFERKADVEGLIGNKYSIRNIFDNGTINPENLCFCNGECVPSGVLNASALFQNAPIFISLPNFFLADPYYINAIEGLKPDPIADDVYVIYEPVSGVLVKVILQTQVNMLLQPIAGIGIYGNVPKYFIPILSIKQSVMLNKKSHSKLRLIQMSPTINNFATLLIFSIGCLLLVFSLRCPKKTNAKCGSVALLKM